MISASANAMLECCSGPSNMKRRPSSMTVVHADACCWFKALFNRDVPHCLSMVMARGGIRHLFAMVAHEYSAPHLASSQAILSKPSCRVGKLC